MYRINALTVLLVACASDYKVHATVDDNEPADFIGEPVEDTAEPFVDTGEPEPEPEPDPDAPVAVCSVSPNTVRPPTEAATWNGSASYDPTDLEIIQYDWSLVYKPDGSSVAMPSGGANRAPFIPDLAGEYIGRLVVKNEAGLTSDPCETTLDSAPIEALWVEMFWESSGDDMDLHLLAPGGILETDTDCYYANCTTTWGTGLDWGIPGDAQDDPSLDLDDITLVGPENINIERPEEAIYTVLVHDYPGSVFDAGNAVTINIYLDGALEWSDTRIIEGEDSYTYFATIDANAGTVTSM